MSPTPTAVGMHLCDQLIVEETTRKVSLFGCFTALTAGSFPTLSAPFCVFASLTDGNGLGAVELDVVRADTGEGIYRRTRQIRFSSRIQVVEYGWRIPGIVFPHPGRYYFSLRVDGEWVAQRSLDLTQRSGV